MNNMIELNKTEVQEVNGGELLTLAFGLTEYLLKKIL